MTPIFSPKPVGCLEELFGRTQEMSNACKYLRIGRSISITAPRRFGKTSFLKMLYKKLENDPQFCPVYLDFTLFVGETTPRDKIYQYILTRMIVALTLQRRFTEDITFDADTIAPSSSEDIVKKRLMRMSDNMVDLFDKFVTYIRDEKDITVLLLIDEYEILLKQGIGLENDKAPFMPIRRLFEKECLQYVISGAEHWGKFESKIGSNQLNWTTNDISLPPLCYDDCQLLLTYELNKIQDSEIRQYLDSYMKEIYNWAGGVPFYAKTIGAHMYVEHSKPDYKLLQSFFDEILNRYIQPQERKILNQLSFAPARFDYNLLSEMVKNGFVRKAKDGENYEIAIGFLRDYLNAQSKGTEDIIPASYQLTKNIVDTMNKINSYEQVFAESKQEFLLIDDMQRPADDRDGVIRFSGAIYKNYWERTNKGQTLPPPFKKESSELVYAILALRHYYNHKDYIPHSTTQMSAQQMFEFFTHNSHEPYLPVEYYAFQTQVLKMLNNELDNLLEYIQKKKG